MKDIVIILPAYNPKEQLIKIVNELKNSYEIIVIDDGSNESNQNIFKEIEQNVKILKHDKNYGKGKAIKTGMEHYLKEYKDKKGIVLADVDGQHSIESIVKTAEELEKENNIILGVRDISKMPIKSKLGNIFIQKILKAKYKIRIEDTQTGLRGIPNRYIQEMMQIGGNRFEYETKMLEYILKNQYKIKQVKIETIYSKKIKSNYATIKDSIQILKEIRKGLQDKS